MNAQEKLRRAYTTQVRGQNAVPPGLSAAKFLTIEFWPRQLMQPIGQDGPKPVPPFPKAMVVQEDGGLRVAWEVSPADPDITLEQFTEEAKRRARLHWTPLHLAPVEKMEQGRQIAYSQLLNQAGSQAVASVIAQATVLFEKFGGEDLVRVVLLGADKDPHTADVVVRIPAKWLEDKEPEDAALEIIHGATDLVAKTS